MTTDDDVTNLAATVEQLKLISTEIEGDLMVQAMLHFTSGRTAILLDEQQHRPEQQPTSSSCCLIQFFHRFSQNSHDSE
jgi:hypothetical protein